MFDKFRSVSLFFKILGLAGIMAFFTAIVAFFAYRQSRILDDRDNIQSIENALLNLRANRIEFATSRKEEFIGKNNLLTKAASMALEKIAKNEAGVAELELALKNHEELWDNFAKAMSERGLTENGGIEGRFRTSAHNLETLFKNIQSPELNLRLMQARRDEKNFIMRKLDKHIKEFDTDIDLLSSGVEASGLPPEQKSEAIALINAYKSTFAELSTVFKKIDSFYNKLDENEAAAIITVEALSAQKQSAAASAERIMYAVISLTFLTGLPIAFFLARSLVRPVKELQVATESLASGQLQTVQVRSRDEIGLLANAFNSMATTLRESNAKITTQQTNLLAQQTNLNQTLEQLEAQSQYLNASVSAILNEMQSLAAGDLTVTLHPANSNDEIGRLFTGFNDVVGNIRTMMTEIIEAVNVTRLIAGQINESKDALVFWAQKQWVQSDEVNTALEEMNKAITYSAQNASETTKFAADNSKIAAEGGFVVAQAVENIRSLADVVKNSASNIQHLGTSSKDIGKIINTIDHIAKRTNLLALNAAIEAARAGEQGRGFAVVADEIAHLAEQTTNATKQIGSMLDQILTDIESATSLMYASSNRVNEGIELADSAGVALREIIDSSRAVLDRISQIASSTEEQSATSLHILSSVENIATTASQSAQETERVASTINNLASVTGQLNNLVHRFRLDKTENFSVPLPGANVSSNLSSNLSSNFQSLLTTTTTQSKVLAEVHQYREEIINAKKGDVIMKEGEKGRGFYIMHTGSLEVFKDGVKITEFSVPETIFGEMSEITNEARTATIIAKSDSKVTYYNSTIDELVRNNPEIAKKLIFTLAMRLINTTNRFTDTRKAKQVSSS